MIPRWVWRAFLGLCALQGAFLLALPVWDWWHYRGPEASSSGSAWVAYRPAAVPPPAGTTERTAPAVLPDRPAPTAAAGPRAVARPEKTPLLAASFAAPRLVAPRIAPPSAAPATHDPAGRTAPGSTPPPVDPGPGVALVPAAKSRNAQATAMLVQAAPPAPAGRPDPGPLPSSLNNDDRGAQADLAPPASDVPPETAEDANLRVVPDRSSVSPGELLKVSVVLEGARQVRSVPFHLHFNPDILEYVGAAEGQVFRGTSLQPILLAAVSATRPGDLAVGLSLVPASGLLDRPGNVVDLQFRVKDRGDSNLILDAAHLLGPGAPDRPVRLTHSAVSAR